jgi:hypothetical protein
VKPAPTDEPNEFSAETVEIEEEDIKDPTHRGEVNISVVGHNAGVRIHLHQNGCPKARKDQEQAYLR